MNICVFDVEVAKEFGADEAIILNSMYFWISKNEANKRNFHDGRTWTYNSLDAWHEIYPFWSKPQIKRKLAKMHENGLILKGNYNNSPYDRTAWYAMTDLSLSIFRNRPIKKSESSLQNTETVPPIPVNKPVNNQEIPQIKDLTVGAPSKFNAFWSLYPKKCGKKSCAAIWKRRKLDNLADLIIADVTRKRIDDVQWSKGYIPNPQTYLNGDRWEDEVQTKAARQEPTPFKELIGNVV